MDCIALYTNSTLKEYLCLLVAEIPRQAINAMTLYLVYHLYDAINFICRHPLSQSAKTVQFVLLLLMLFALIIYAINMVTSIW